MTTAVRSWHILARVTQRLDLFAYFPENMLQVAKKKKRREGGGGFVYRGPVQGCRRGAAQTLGIVARNGGTTSAFTHLGEISPTRRVPHKWWCPSTIHHVGKMGP